MKMIPSITATSLLCLALFSCGNSHSNNNTKSDENNALNSSISDNSLKEKSKGDNKCLLSYQSKYDQLLSQDDVLKETGFDKSKLTAEYLRHMKSENYHEYRYSFANGRVGFIPGTKREFEQDDYVCVKYIEEMSMEMFQYNYKVPTEEEIQQTKQILEDVVDGKIENDKAKEEVKKLEEKNINKETIKKTGSALTDIFAEAGKGYIKINDLGDAAAWNTNSYELNVLQNGVKFTIVSNVSNDKEKNKKVAINLAKVILNKCL